MHRLDNLHPDIVSDTIHDALGNLECCDRAAGVQKQLTKQALYTSFVDLRKAYDTVQHGLLYLQGRAACARLESAPAC